MEILDIAREQLNSADQGEIFENYRDFFEEVREFGPNVQNYFQTTRERLRQLDDNMAQKRRDLIGKIDDSVP